MSTAEQERAELYEASRLAYEEQLRRELAQDWIAHHRLQVTFDGLAAHHEREQERYRRMLVTTTEGESNV